MTINIICTILLTKRPWAMPAADMSEGDVRDGRDGCESESELTILL